MADKNKIWYPEEVVKAIEDFYKDIRKGGKSTKTTPKLNNVKTNGTNNNTLNFISTLTAPPVRVLSLF